MTTEAMWSGKDEIDSDFRILFISNREKPGTWSGWATFTMLRAQQHADVLVSVRLNYIIMCQRKWLK
jgi:hypothetical protein